MRSLPLLLAARLLPVAALATAGWAWTSGPYAPTENRPAVAAEPKAAEAEAEAEAEATYGKPPAPCDVLRSGTVEELVPGADRGGKELRLTDPGRRRTCSWSALKGYDYRWLDVGYDVRESAAAARSAYAARTEGSAEAVAGLGEQAAVLMELSEKDGQQSREAKLVVRSHNAVVTVTYNGSDFETQSAPKAETVRDGAERAARAAVEALGEPRER
ncbi:hypothetical protein QIS99_03380 [Streptomyces sp. B-S-A8]|uniref:DUF3558 domain-containing protein n=1 Tax=Streptomyces solicavernae TaxID=3043614 RepID=A0ABT6RLG0_9ACTN|nr:hypothetical protein [Streptomyces sp. B-S-A8]MDI3385262.1 hypothetical protein [Streptomyces sp. B-S-A8]